MKLYFLARSGEERLLATVDTEEDAFREIQKFLDEHNFKSYYTRITLLPGGGKWIDYGSHTEFFEIRPEKGNE